MFQLPYLEGYLASAHWCVPRFANPWSIFSLWQRRDWDEGWSDAITDRRPLPARRVEPECVLHD